MELDSDDDKTMAPPLVKYHESDSDDDSDKDSDEDSNGSGHHGNSSSGDDNLMHYRENLGYLHDSIADHRHEEETVGPQPPQLG